ncbi:MAG: DNA polymerase [Candidatus Thorarchaeota archaeon]|jgi:DNA polymerase-1
MNAQISGHEIITDPADAVRLLAHDELIGFDAETTGFSPWRNSLALLQFYGDKTGTLAIIRTPDGIIPPAIKDLLEDPTKKFAVHNGVAFDIPFLATHGVDPYRAAWFDTLVAETAIVPTNRRDISVSLRASVKRRLDVEVDKSIEHSNWGASALSDDQLKYAASDVLNLPALVRAQLERAEEAKVTPGLEMEQELVPLVASMTITGLPFSIDKWKEYIAEQHRKRDIAYAELKDLMPEIKNWRSPKQLGEALHSRGVPLPKTKSGQFSTRAEILEEFSRYGGKRGAMCRLVLEYRNPDQRIKTYTQEWVDKFTIPHGDHHRIHAKFWQCSTDTTRFASSEPNLQQIPKDMRYVCGHVPGHKMVTPDYSQIEVLITAAVAGDTAMLQHLADGGDVHALVGQDVLGIPIDQQTEDDRRFAKAVVFTMLFGGGPQRIIDYTNFSDLSIGENEVYDFFNLFLERFPGIKQMRDKAAYRAQGYPKIPVTITLPSGLKRRLVGKMVRPPVIINTMVQGSAAVGIKLGMLEVDRAGVFKGNVCSQVHDELPSCVPEEFVDEFVEIMKKSMADGMTQAIDQPCLVEAKVGDGWPK